jgi:hypothetical protein
MARIITRKIIMYNDDKISSLPFLKINYLSLVDKAGGDFTWDKHTHELPQVKFLQRVNALPQRPQ